VIEAHLWKIPGLSSNFIYFNDDFFLLRPVAPADFLRKSPSSSLASLTNPSSSSSSTSSSIHSFVAQNSSSTIASSPASSPSSLPSTSHSLFPPFSDTQYLIYLDTAILPPSGNREALYKYERNIFKGAMIKTNILLDLHFRRERSSKDISSAQEGEGEVEQNRFYFRHSPRMLSRFLFQELFQEFTSEFQELKKPMHRQRSPKDIHPLFLYYHFMLKKHSESFHPLSNFESGLRCKVLFLSSHPSPLTHRSLLTPTSLHFLISIPLSMFPSTTML
jgi:hypothetical protein